VSTRNRYVAVLAATLLSACGGGGSSLPVSPVTGAATVPTPSATAVATTAPSKAPSTAPSSAPSSAAVTQSFTITIPAAASSSNALRRGRRPLYVSPNTASIVISLQSVNGAPSSLPPTIASTLSGSPGCTATTAGLTCLVTATALAGSDVFAIATYQSANGSGAPLATSTIAATVTNPAAPAIALTLGGVPAGLAFSPGVLPLVNDGAIHRYPVTVDAVDASGATIVGSSAFASGVGLTLANDPTHAISLSTASVTVPGTIVTITFDGSKNLANASITATATGATSAVLTAAPVTFSPASLFAYDDQSGGVTTTISQSGFTGTFSAMLANPSDGSIAVTSGPLGTGSASASVIPAVTFDVTALDATNGTYPATISVTIVPHPGPYTAFGAAHILGTPVGLVEASDGTLWTADAQNGALTNVNPSTGTYTSYVVDPSDAGPTSVAFDTSGTLWYADGAQIGSFDTSTHVVKTYTTGLYPNARVLTMAKGPAGTMWFYDERTNAVPYSAGAPTAFGTIATASGTIVEFPTPDNAAAALSFESMVLGPDGALWFADGSAGAIGRVTAAGAYTSYAAAGPVSPNFATDVVSNAPDGNIWFAGTNQGLGQGFIGTLNLATKTVALYSQNVESGAFEEMIPGSDHNLWFAEQPGSGDFFSSQYAIGVINVTTHATYPYTAIVPQFAVIEGLVDPGNRTLYMLDTAYGQVGKVPFK
jgi:streptogramin lyase